MEVNPTWNIEDLITEIYVSVLVITEMRTRMLILGMNLHEIWSS